MGVKDLEKSLYVALLGIQLYRVTWQLSRSSLTHDPVIVHDVLCSQDMLKSIFPTFYKAAFCQLPFGNCNSNTNYNYREASKNTLEAALENVDEIIIWSQFYQHVMNSFFANFHSPKKYKHKLWVQNSLAKHFGKKKYFLRAAFALSRNYEP